MRPPPGDVVGAGQGEAVEQDYLVVVGVGRGEVVEQDYPVVGGVGQGYLVEPMGAVSAHRLNQVSEGQRSGG